MAYFPIFLLILSDFCFDMENSKNITVGEMSRTLQAKLSPIYGSGEARAMTRLIFHSLKGWSLTDMVIHEDNPLSDYIIEKINDITSRLLNHEPIQYILGEAYFYGMNLKVDRSTLIPRPETEQLVDIIVKDNNLPDLKVIDIATGSGAIAIALGRNLKFPEVSALDISENALNTARENASALHANVNFFHADIFTYMPRSDSFDIIVSNPPYIDESEKSGMDRNVLDYEPHSALFVPDDNPLIFYSRIAEIAKEALKQNGKLYLEINPRHAGELQTLLNHESFADISIIKDINNRQRFIKCTKE